jgi:hypothetical protein
VVLVLEAPRPPGLWPTRGPDVRERSGIVERCAECEPAPFRDVATRRHTRGIVGEPRGGPSPLILHSHPRALRAERGRAIYPYGRTITRYPLIQTLRASGVSSSSMSPSSVSVGRLLTAACRAILSLEKHEMQLEHLSEARLGDTPPLIFASFHSPPATTRSNIGA